MLRSLWQVMTYVLGAALVATWIWVWNTQSELINLRNMTLRIPELILRADSNRSVIETSSAKIARLEEAALRALDDRTDLRVQDHELREALDNMTQALSALQSDHARLLEIVRQMRLVDDRPTGWGKGH